MTITFCCLFFFTEGLARPVNNKPPKKQINAEIQVTLKKEPARKRAEVKMFYTLSQQITKPNYKLILLTSESVSINFIIWITLYYYCCNPEPHVKFKSKKDNVSQVKRYILKKVVRVMDFEHVFTVMLLFLRFRSGGFIVNLQQISRFSLFSCYQF